jgi:fatty acid desaturase
VSDSKERIAAYEANIARFTEANAGLRAEPRRMKWVAVVTLVLSVAAYRWFGTYPVVFVLIIGASVFFVGHYLVYMHIHENRLTIKSPRQTIASLKAPPS